MPDGIPLERRIVLVDQTVLLHSPESYPANGTKICVLSAIDCTLASHHETREQWGNGEGCLEHFIPNLPDPYDPYDFAVALARRLVFDHSEEKWADTDEPFNSIVVGVFISESTWFNLPFLVLLLELQDRMKALGYGNMPITVTSQRLGSLEL